MAAARTRSRMLAAVETLKNPDLQWDTFTESVRQAQAAQFRIKSLPAEIRLLIFRHYLAPQACNCLNASALVAALRPDVDMYAEVLEAFFAVRNFRVGAGNKKSITTTSKEVLARITSLEVAYSMDLKKTSWEFEFTTHLPIPLLRNFTSLKSITLTTPATVLHPTAQRKLAQQAKDFIVFIPNLTSLTIHLPIPLANVSDTLLTEPTHIYEPTSTINTATGINQVFLPSPFKDNIALQWTASPSSPKTPFSHPSHPRLTWTDHTHFRSTPWRNCNTLFTFLTLYHRIEFWYDQNLSFAGLNPRRTLVLCSVKDCVCTRLVAVRCPIEKKMRKNEGWIVFRPKEARVKTEEELDAEREVFKIPEELGLDALRAKRWAV